MHGLPARAPRHLRMPPHVGSARHPTLTTRHTPQSIERENPAGLALERPNSVETVTLQDDRDYAWAYAPQSYRRSSLDKATLSGTKRKARKCAYQRRSDRPIF
jgi:hypothetical protein